MGGNGNWDQLIRAIVPLTFLAIWAITSLFNRESKTAPPARSTTNPPGFGPRPGEPAMRWSPPANPRPGGQPATARRVPMGDDDIMVIPSDGSRGGRATPIKPTTSLLNRRGTKGRPAAAPVTRAEPVSTRTKLAGVSQNVNQHLTSVSIDMAPLTAMPASATSMSMSLATAPSVAAVAYHAPLVTLLSAALADPVRLREAIIISEILQPPLALRGKRGGR